jgi:hypothetical protein
MNSPVPSRHWSCCAMSSRRSAPTTCTAPRRVTTGMCRPWPTISSTPSPASPPPPAFQPEWCRRGLTSDVVFGGRTLHAHLALGILSLELVVHGWDFAMAIHRPLDVSDAHAAHVLTLARQTLNPQSRITAGFDPPVRVPANASPFERLIAFTGRDPVQVFSRGDRQER